MPVNRDCSVTVESELLFPRTFECFVDYIHGVLIHLHVIGNTEVERTVVTVCHVVKFAFYSKSRIFRCSVTIHRFRS